MYFDKQASSELNLAWYGDFPYFPEAADLTQSSEMYRFAHIGLYLRTCASVVGVFEYVYAQWT